MESRVRVVSYKLGIPITGETEPHYVIRDIDGANIPFDSNNKDYQTYLQWVAEGNTAEEWEGM
jgi:hypothetical protein